MKRLAVSLSVLILIARSVIASPEERTQLLKSKIMERLVLDGWHITNESAHVLAVTKPMQGAGSFFFQLFATGPNGTAPIVKMEITFLPKTDHWTLFFVRAAMESQNAFGQTQSVPIRNKKPFNYVSHIATQSAATFPVKYLAAKPSE